jgi:MscS family membrane protein
LNQTWAEETNPPLDEAVAEFTPYPLRPPNVESPRATLRSFIKHANQAIELWRNEDQLSAIRRAADRAMHCLDLRAIPRATRDDIGVEKFLLLKEILDRIELPPFEEIPDIVAVTEDGLKSWTVPNTELTLVRIEEGPRTGSFLFSKETVELLEGFYEHAKILPYKPGASIGVYEDYLYGPGSLVSRSWFLDLPSWAYVVFGQQTLWQWSGLLFILVVVFGAIFLVYRCGKWWDNRFRDTIVWIQIGKPLSSLFVILAMRLLSLFATNVLNITGLPLIVIEFGTHAVIYLAVAWFATLIITRTGEGVISARRLRPASLNSQLVRISIRLISIIVVAYICVVAAESFGVPVAPIIAGLGVGGLAIALAVRPTIENIVGGFILFADKPVRVGDYCRFGDEYGTVEEIGLRSTRLRKFDDTLVTVPNGDFSQRELTNFALRRQRLYHTTLGLRYETTPEQLRYVMAKFREMLLGHPKVSPDWLYVRFDGFGDYSLNIEIYAYIRAREWLNYGAIREDISFRIMEIVKEAGTGFAFPSQTAYLGRDSGLDAERVQEAETQVQAWRSEGQLPFPDFDEVQRKKKEDILDYPPEGSPDYKPRADVSKMEPKPAAEQRQKGLQPRIDESEGPPR